MRIKINIGDILQVELPDGRHTYAQISTSPLVIFYEYATHDQVELSSIPQLPIAFKVFVDKDVLRSGDWPKLGNVPMSKEALQIPYMYKQDIINGKLSIYHTDFEKTNFERPANMSEVENLECAAVWNKSSIEERLVDHFGEKKNEWKRRSEIKFDKVPDHQKV